MRRLLWKEFRERRWWALIWFLSIFSISLFGGGQAFYGEREMLPTLYLPLPLVISLLVGTGAYAGELANGRAQSVFSRPITPRALLAAKLLFAIVICLGAPLLAAAVAWCIAPESYRHLMTPSSLLSGALGAAWKYGLVYLLGLTCSVVISGLAGGILTLAGAILPLVAVMAQMPNSYSFGTNFAGWNLHNYACRAGWFFGCWLGVTCAGLSITRFALVLGNDERVKRFTLLYLPLFLACGVTGALMPSGLVGRLLMHWEISSVSISPSAKYALISEQRCPFNFGFLAPSDPRYGEMRYLIRLSDLKQFPVRQGKFEIWDWRWVTDEIAYSYDWLKNRLILTYPARGLTREVQMTGGTFRPSTVSPDARLLVLHSYHVETARTLYSDEKRSKNTYITVWRAVDLQTGQIVGEKRLTFNHDPSIHYLWKSDHTLTLQDRDGKPEYLHIIPK